MDLVLIFPSYTDLYPGPHGMKSGNNPSASLVNN